MIETLISCESAFVAAGQRARELQAGIRPELKTETGDYSADVVTAADREAQRIVLEALVCTRAVECTLVAEEAEAPELMSRFAGGSGLVLSLDPIDGTRRYTEGKPHYCTIVGLHDGTRPLYTFVYYPALEWWMRLTDEGVETSGPAPVVEVGDVSRKIVYTAGNPSQELREKVGRVGYEFAKGDDLGPCGSKFLVLAGLVGGYYAGNPNAYDGLFGLHHGLAAGRQVLSTVDLSRLEESPRGLRYGGFYLVMPPGLEP